MPKELTEAELTERALQDKFFGSIEIDPEATVPTASQLEALRRAADAYYRDLAKRRALAKREERTPPPRPHVFRRRMFFTAYMEAQYRALHAVWERRLTTGKREKTPERAAAQAAKKAQQLAALIRALQEQGAGSEAAEILAKIGL